MQQQLYLICLLVSVACISAQDVTVPSTVATESTKLAESSSVQSTAVTTPGTTEDTNTNFTCAVCRSDNELQTACASDDVGESFKTSCQFQPGTNATLKACYIQRTGRFFI